MIKIDGSKGEGGGQIIRTAVAMSAVTGKDVWITRIRANRKPSGLKAQHLTSVNAAAELCSAEVKGNQIGSKELVFKPGKIRQGKFNFDIGTAGSISLVLQALTPIAAFSKDRCSFTITGGTDVWMSPTIDFFIHVFSDYMKQMGFEIKTQILRRGFYPKGGGKVRVVTKPWKNKKPYVHIKQGTLEKMDIISVCSDFLKKRKVAERQAKGFKQALAYKDEKIVYCKSFSPGTSFHAHAHYSNCKLGACGVGERGKPAEKVGKEVALKLKKEIDSKATVDERMSDQIMIYLAFAGGSFKTSRITNHLKTNKHVIEKFLGKKFEIKNKEVKAISP